jgi:hypothetical protein
MPRIRSLKPEALQHRKVGRLSDRAFRLWIGMLTQADDAGRLIFDTESLRVLCFGYHPKVKSHHISDAINEVLSLGLVRMYTISGVYYLDFPSWSDHQVVNKESPSFLPSYEDRYIVTEYTGNGQGLNRLDRTLPDLTLPDLTRPDLAAVTIPALARKAEFERFWSAYPSKVGKGYAHTCFLRAIQSTTIEILLNAIANQRTWSRWQEGYIPNPSTWLNQQRWLDEAPKPRRPKTDRTDRNIEAVKEWANGGVRQAEVLGNTGEVVGGVPARPYPLAH